MRIKGDSLCERDRNLGGGARYQRQRRLASHHFTTSNQMCFDIATWLILTYVQRVKCQLPVVIATWGWEGGSDQGNEFSITASSKSLNSFTFRSQTSRFKGFHFDLRAYKTSALLLLKM